MKRTLLLMVLLVMIFPLGIQASAYSNTSHNWHYNRGENHSPSTTEPEFVQWLEMYGGVFQGDTNNKTIYLTFDNGYEQGYTDDMLDVLKEKNVPAAFFVTGNYIKKEPDLIRRMVEEGHIVGNHSMHHADLTNVGAKRLKKEVEELEQVYTKVTGKKDMKYFRAPRGVFSERTLALTEKLGYTNVFWSLAFVDWKTDHQKGWKYAYDKVLEQIHPGAVLLLHTVSEDNAKALAKVIDALRKNGYTFKSLDSLMAHKHTPDFVW